MIGVKLLFTVTHNEFVESYVEYFRESGVNMITTKLCLGTAKAKTLNLLGLQHKEKTLLQAMITNEQAEVIMKGLNTKLYIGERDNGMAFTVPVDGIGGESSKDCLLGDLPIKKGVEKMKAEKSKCVLIITIADKGNVDLVMDAARGAGASGGTVVKAKGTGTELAKFFGVSISDEKEIVYVVCEREKRDDIMYAIMDKAGVKTNAHGIVFSLPVDNVVGIKSLEKLFD